MSYNTITLRLGDLIPRYATREENPNKMDEERYMLLVKAIGKVGFLQPILVSAGKEPDDPYTIEDGHHRWWAARDAKLKEVTAVVIKPEELDEYTRRAVGVGMNRLRGDLDLGMTSGLLREMTLDTEWSMEELGVLTGFTLGEIEALLKTDEQSLDEQSLPDVPQDDAPGKPFVLEISFADKGQYQLVRRKLRKAAGKGGDLSTGLLNVLGELDKDHKGE